MKHTLITTILFLLAMSLFGQKNEVNIYMNNATGGGVVNYYSTIGLGYYHEILPKLKLGISCETPLVINNSYSFYFKVDLKELSFNYIDKIKLNNIDLLTKYTLLKKEKYTLNLIGGITYQHYNITNIPLIEIKDLEIIYKTEVNSTKSFILPKLGMNAELKLYKSFYLSGLIYVRTTPFLKSKEIYTNKNIYTTSDNSSSGYSSSIMTIEEQLGFILGFTYKF